MPAGLSGGRAAVGCASYALMNALSVAAGIS